MILDLGLSTHVSRIPNKTDAEKTRMMFDAAPESVKTYARILRDSQEWRFYAVNYKRGFCEYSTRIITIPIWVWHRDIKNPGYSTYYISHELAHAFTKGDAHGQKFMAKFKEICPPELWHFEVEYKPRNARTAGISDRQSENKNWNDLNLF